MVEPQYRPIRDRSLMRDGGAKKVVGQGAKKFIRLV